MRRVRGLSSWVSAAVAVIVFVGVDTLVSRQIISTYWAQVVQMGCVAAITSLGLNLIYGFNGQFSLGHIGFYAIGAYASALITKDWTTRWSGSSVGALSFIVALQVGVVVAAVVTTVLRVGTLRKWARDRLSAYVSNFEAIFLSTLMGLVLSGVAIAVGFFVGREVQRYLPVLLEPALAGASPEIAQTIVFALALVVGALLAALVGFLVGMPLLTLTSDYFGIATLGFSIMVYNALQNSDLVVPTMKGARGMVGIPRWTTWGWVFGCLVVVIVIARNYVYSSQGRAAVSVREDEVAAKAMGIDTVRYKAISFALGCLFAGLAGGLYAHLYSFLHPSTFHFVKGFDPLIIIVFGGLGSMTGTLVASFGWAFVLEGLRVLLPQGFEDWRFVIYPVILLIIMLLRPQGLFGGTELGFLKGPSVATDRCKPAAVAALDQSGNTDEQEG
jgi:branched-chain amino acid transport system permease protein